MDSVLTQLNPVVRKSSNVGRQLILCLFDAGSIAGDEYRESTRTLKTVDDDLHLRDLC